MDAIVMITLVARNTNNFLQEGKHIVSIKSVTPAEPQGEAEWKDKTPQLKVTFIAKNGSSFSNWYNLKGFKLFSELTLKEQQSGKFSSVGDNGYAVVTKTSMRVEDPAKSESAQNILCKLAFDAGVAEGGSFTEADLVGKTVGITIGGNERGNDRVKGSFAPSAEQVKSGVPA